MKFVLLKMTVFVENGFGWIKLYGNSKSYEIAASMHSNIY